MERLKFVPGVKLETISYGWEIFKILHKGTACVGVFQSPFYQVCPFFVLPGDKEKRVKSVGNQMTMRNHIWCSVWRACVEEV